MHAATKAWRESLRERRLAKQASDDPNGDPTIDEGQDEDWKD